MILKATIREHSHSQLFQLALCQGRNSPGQERKITQTARRDKSYLQHLKHHHLRVLKRHLFPCSHTTLSQCLQKGPANVGKGGYFLVATKKSFELKVSW